MFSSNSGYNSGGAIYNNGNLTVSNSTFSNNSGYAQFYGYGGGIYNEYDKTATVKNSSFTGNTVTGDGGAIYNSGFFTLNYSTVSNNSAGNFGGGIISGGTLTVKNTTISHNTATQFSGGGLLQNPGTAAVPGIATIVNSTFYENSASAGEGGGIYNSDSEVDVSNSTFDGNSALRGGGFSNEVNSGVTTLKNTLLANSSGGNCYDATPSHLAASDGYNLSDDSSCSFLTVNGDMTSTAAGLDPAGLQDNGGPTQTVALQATSYAVDKIPTSSCSDIAGNTLTTDQRGVTRPQGANCDIGAFELVPSTVAFSTLDAKLKIVSGTQPGFSLQASFTLGATSNGINPLTEAVTLQVATYQVTIPAGSFKLLTHGSKAGSYAYSGVVNGVTVAVQISAVSGTSYQLTASASPVTAAVANPISVTITIGDDSGSTSVTAKFQ